MRVLTDKVKLADGLSELKMGFEKVGSMDYDGEEVFVNVPDLLFWKQFFHSGIHLGSANVFLFVAVVELCTAVQCIFGSQY